MHSDRNISRRLLLGFMIAGCVLSVIGVRVALITRLNLLTGHTSYPDLAIGIVMMGVGVSLLALARLAARKG